MTENEISEKLRQVLTSLDPGLVIKRDQPDYYYLNTNTKVKGKDMFFGAVQIRRSYVAYHLYPVYTHPELLDDISDDLKKRMQRKSCFNFKKEITAEQLDEINELTKKSYTTFLQMGYIEN